MLPADSAHRLVLLLTQALEDCAEQKQQLQQNLTQCRDILGDWNSQALETQVPEDSNNDHQESRPSATELEELELLNKALKKALRIRTKFQQAPCKAIDTIDSAKKAGKKAVIGAAVKQQADHSKEGISETTKLMASKKPTAYMLKAPYRTDPNVKRPQLKMSDRLSSRASKMSVKKNSPMGASSPKLKSPAKIAQVSCKKVCASEEPRMPLDSLRLSHCAKLELSFGNSMGEGDAVETAALLSEAQHNLFDPSAESVVTSRHRGEGISSMSTTSQTSTLQEKGSLLKLPLPYEKAFSRYTRLGEKCRLCQTSPEAAAARNRFMEKLQATFSLPSPAFSPFEVKKEIMHLREMHFLVSQCMEAETPASLGENPSWQRQYESLLTLEGLQMMVDQCLDKVHQLGEAMESHLRLFPADLACSKECVSVRCTSPGRPRCCDAETSKSPPLLFYSSLKELMEMETLKLKVAMLHQQLDIQKAMETELLPLLEPGRVPENSRASLFRAIYALLCEGGERFPVLVNDEELSS